MPTSGTNEWSGTTSSGPVPHAEANMAYKKPPTTVGGSL